VTIYGTLTRTSVAGCVPVSLAILLNDWSIGSERMRAYGPYYSHSSGPRLMCLGHEPDDITASAQRQILCVGSVPAPYCNSACQWALSSRLQIWERPGAGGNIALGLGLYAAPVILFANCTADAGGSDVADRFGFGQCLTFGCVSSGDGPGRGGCQWAAWHAGLIAGLAESSSWLVVAQCLGNRDATLSDGCCIKHGRMDRIVRMLFW